MAYRPVLIGVRHEKPFFGRVKEALVRHAPPGGRVALEIPPGKRVRFWSALKKFAEKQGFEVVSIESRLARDIGERKQLALSFMKEGLEELEERRRFDYITKILGTGFMRKRILRERPDVIIVGADHANLLKQDIPVKKYVQVVDKDYVFDRGYYKALKWWRGEKKRGVARLLEAAGKLARGEKL